MCARVRACVYVCVRARVRAYMCACVRVYVRVYMCACVRVYVCADERGAMCKGRTGDCMRSDEGEG